MFFILIGIPEDEWAEHGNELQVTSCKIQVEQVPTWNLLLGTWNFCGLICLDDLISKILDAGLGAIIADDRML